MSLTGGKREMDKQQRTSQSKKPLTRSPPRKTQSPSRAAAKGESRTTILIVTVSVAFALAISAVGILTTDLTAKPPEGPIGINLSLSPNLANWNLTFTKVSSEFRKTQLFLTVYYPNGTISLNRTLLALLSIPLHSAEYIGDSDNYVEVGESVYLRTWRYEVGSKVRISEASGVLLELILT